MLVTDARLGSGVAMIRSLARRGFHVTAADSHRLSAGFYSRGAHARLVYPSPVEAPDETVDALLVAARERAIDLIFPVTDEVVLPLARERARFDGVATLALPEPAALAATIDKASTTALAQRLGIPTPRTAVVETPAEAVEAAKKLGWPVVLKPQASRSLESGGGVRAFGVAYANDVDELAHRMSMLAGRSRVLIQEYCAGEARGVGLLADRGRVLSAFQYRRLREVPVTGGPSSFRESVDLESPHYEHAVRLLQALGWTGLAMVEFKGDPAEPKLMEVNGRVWGSIALAVKSGVDFPARAASLYLGDEVPADDQYAVGVRSRDVRLELSWIASVLSGKRTYAFLPRPKRWTGLRVLGRLLIPSDGYDILSVTDPVPGVIELAGLAPRAYRRTRRNALRRKEGRAQ